MVSEECAEGAVLLQHLETIALRCGDEQEEPVGEAVGVRLGSTTRICVFPGGSVGQSHSDVGH